MSTVYKCISRVWKWKNVRRGSRINQQYLIFPQRLRYFLVFFSWTSLFEVCADSNAVLEAVSAQYKYFAALCLNFVISPPDFPVLPNSLWTMSSILKGSYCPSIHGGTFKAIMQLNAMFHRTRPSGKLIDAIISHTGRSWCTPKRDWETYGGSLSQCLLQLRKLPWSP